ncbi:hypothetical protein SDC9_130413 [bioreactor metagenome]|uniref:ABC transmembrane type-1 domain-containing protein n=1 Tax=bioreactor metagenome TaxID=1076179 RepID=A0A645D2B8_9ZZZZ
MLPFVIPQVIAVSAVNAGYVVLTESAVSFLGFGVSYPYASWGNMIMTGFSLQDVNRYAYVWIPAGILIFLLVFSFHLIGEGLCTEAGEDMLV